MTADVKILVLGGVNWDTTLRVAHLPRPGESIVAGAMSDDIGGKGLNQAVAVSRAGADVYLVGATGADAEGDRIRDFLAGEGISTRFLARLSNTPTGRAFITVDAAAENTIAIALGANEALADSHIAELDGTWTELAGVVANLEAPVAVVAALFGQARAHGIPTVLNPSPLPDTLESALLNLTDVLVVNQAEAQALARSADGPDVLAAALRALGPRQVVVTLGAKGSVLCNQDGVSAVAAMPVEAVDPTAAGDTFLGYFVVGCAQGLQALQALERASQAAAQCVRTPGASASIPRAAELATP